MRDYSKISPQFWVGETGRQIRKLGVEVQLIALYVLTCPHATMLGIYYLPLAYIAHDTGISIEGASKALQSLCEVQFCTYDEPSEFIWVYEMASYQIGNALDPKDKRVKGINDSYAALPNLPFLKAFYDKYHAAFHLESCRESTILRSPLEVPLKPLASQEQEQEQYQEQEQEQEQEEEHEEENAAADSGEASLRAAPPVTISLPLITIPLKSGSDFPIDADMLVEWQKLFSAIDVKQVLCEIRSWNIANPNKRKTPQGIHRHIQGWLAKENKKFSQPHFHADRYSTLKHPNAVFEHNRTSAREWLHQTFLSEETA